MHIKIDDRTCEGIVLYKNNPEKSFIIKHYVLQNLKRINAI